MPRAVAYVSGRARPGPLHEKLHAWRHIRADPTGRAQPGAVLDLPGVVEDMPNEPPGGVTWRPAGPAGRGGATGPAPVEDCLPVGHHHLTVALVGDRKLEADLAAEQLLTRRDVLCDGVSVPAATPGPLRRASGAPAATSSRPSQLAASKAAVRLSLRRRPIGIIVVEHCGGYTEVSSTRTGRDPAARRTTAVLRSTGTRHPALAATSGVTRHVVRKSRQGRLFPFPRTGQAGPIEAAGEATALTGLYVDEVPVPLRAGLHRTRLRLGPAQRCPPASSAAS